MSLGVYGGESRAIPRWTVTVLLLQDVGRWLAMLLVGAEDPRTPTAAPAVLRWPFEHRWLALVLAALAAGAIVQFGRRRRTLTSGSLALLPLGYLAESQAVLTGSTEHDLLIPVALLVGWLFGVRFARELDGRLARSSSPEHDDALGEAGARGAFAAVYLGACTSKLLEGGAHWADGRSLLAHIVSQHPFTGGPLDTYLAFVVDHPSLATLFAVATMLIQAGMILYLLGPRLQMVWAALIVAFHVNAYLLMGVKYVTGIAAALALSYPWPRIFRRLRGLRSGARALETPGEAERHAVGWLAGQALRRVVWVGALTLVVWFLVHAGDAATLFVERERPGGRHARDMVLQGRRGWALAESWGLAGFAGLATATGGVVLWGGQIGPGHALHAWSGLAIGVVLAVHLLRARRVLPSVAVATLLGGSLAGGAIVRRSTPAGGADEPRDLFQATSSALYEPASDCGECHAEEYDEWRRSTHGRTMTQPLIRADMEAHVDELNFDLADYGALARGEHVPHEAMVIGACKRCHVPTDFYGDRREDPRRPTGVAAEGITCSFCHSVRAVHAGVARGAPLPAMASATDWPSILPRLPYYVSAPERAHRYLGEGSGNPLMRWMARALIRWRPEVHRADFDAPVLRTAQACMPCHSSGDFDAMPDQLRKTFVAWEEREYTTGDPATQPLCQDCHMATELTGLRSHERGSFVPWGPVRDGHRSHLFLGGHTNIATLVHDPDLAAQEHALNARAVSMDLVGVRALEGVLEVDVRLESHDVAHYLPALEAQTRFLWVELAATDATGRVLATTPSPRTGADAGGDTPVVFRCPGPHRDDCDDVLHPRQPRTLTGRLRLPASSRPVSVSAALRLSVDRDPLAILSARLVPPG